MGEATKAPNISRMLGGRLMNKEVVSTLNSLIFLCFLHIVEIHIAAINLESCKRSIVLFKEFEGGSADLLDVKGEEVHIDMEASYSTADEVNIIAFLVRAEVVLEGRACRIDGSFSFGFVHFVKPRHVEGKEATHATETMEEVHEPRFVFSKFAYETWNCRGASMDVKAEVAGFYILCFFETIVH